MCVLLVRDGPAHTRRRVQSRDGVLERARKGDREGGREWVMEYEMQGGRG